MENTTEQTSNLETTREELEAPRCIMGASTPSPCPFPGTEVLPHWHPDAGLRLCRFHAATEPLAAESDGLAVSLELVRAYLKGARRQPGAGLLVEVLEHVEAAFSERAALVDKVLEDLKEAEFKLMR